MRISIIKGPFTKEDIILFSEKFADKLQLIDFINEFFLFIKYGYQVIDGNVCLEKLDNNISNDRLIIYYDDEDKIKLNLCGIYQVVINDITFEKIL